MLFPLFAARPMRRFSGMLPLHGAAHMEKVQKFFFCTLQIVKISFT